MGGAEVVLSQIEAALAEIPFRSLVVAHAASRPHGRLFPVAVPDGEITDALRTEVEARVQRAIDEALATAPVALVHMHGLDFHRYRIPASMPVLVTLHLPPAWYPESIWSLPSSYQFLCVSETERQACPQPVRDRIRVIPNGVPLPARETLRAKGRYAVMLARVCAEKNLHVGFQAAALAGMPALLAGAVFPYPEHQRYFAEEIAPRLIGSETPYQAQTSQLHAAEARFLGSVTGAAKTRLLARAACLLLPSLAPETSSLVAMEALAAGVPVIGMASGAVPEIIEDGKTGFLLDPALGSGPEAARAMADAIARLPTLNRQVCREVAEERFGLPRMLQAYQELYRETMRDISPVPGGVAEGRTAPPAQKSDVQRTTSSRLEHISRNEDLWALAADWETLWQADSQATPFQHPAWLLPWWRQFGPEGELHTLVLRDDAGLLALLPLYVYQEPERRERQLLLLGAGTTDYLDGLFCTDSDPAALAQVLLDHARTTLRCWDRLVFAQMRGGSPLLAAAAAHTGAGRIAQTAGEPCSTLRTGRQLPAKVAGNVRRYRRRAEALGSLRFSVASTPEDALANFEDLARLHRERWEARGERGVLADPRVLAHHREAIPLLLGAGLLRLFRATLNDQVLGVLYALADAPQRRPRSLYLYLIGVDMRSGDLSPGTLLLHAAWQYAREHGFDRVDLLRGGEEYKRFWGAELEPTYTLEETRRPSERRQRPQG